MTTTRTTPFIFFDKTKNIVVSQNGMLPVLNGSNLTNLPVENGLGNVVVTDANVNANAYKRYICSNAGGTTITLPAATNGQYIGVSAQTLTNGASIIINPFSGDTIATESTLIIDVEYGYVELVYSSGDWKVVLPFIPSVQTVGNDYTTADQTRLAASVTYSASLPTAAEALAGRVYIMTSDSDNKPAGSHWKCVASGETYIWQSLSTSLQVLSGDTVTAYPGQVYTWTVASASVTLNASGFTAGSGCFIDIAVPTGSLVGGGTGVTIVDALEENKLNHMALQEVAGDIQLLRWLESEDIPT